MVDASQERGGHKLLEHIKKTVEAMTQSIKMLERFNDDLKLQSTIVFIQRSSACVLSLRCECLLSTVFAVYFIRPVSVSIIPELDHEILQK